MISRLTKDSVAVRKSSGPVGALVLLPDGDGFGTDSWPVAATAAAGRATTRDGMVRATGAVDAVAAGTVGADASIAGVSGAVVGVGAGTARDEDDRSTRATLSFGTDPLGR